MKKYIKYIIFLLLLLLTIILVINIYVLSFSRDNYYKNIDSIENTYVGLVFGASVIGKDKPSDILKDRLNVAYNAYEDKKIEKIIVSGDNSESHYNEPVAMQKYLINMGVDIDDIYLDYAGFDTYDSLYRAKKIFGVEKLVLFTQDFHLKRAMYISTRLGIKSIGVTTNSQKYINEDYNNFREIFARIKAFLDVEICKSKPTYLGDEIEIITDEKIDKAKSSILKG